VINLFSYFIEFFADFITALTVLIVLVAFNWMIAAVLIIGALPAVFFSVEKTKIVWKNFKAVTPIRRHMDYYKDLIQADIRAIQEIKIFNLKSYFIKNYTKLSERYIKSEEKVVKESVKMGVIGRLIQAVSILAAIWLMMDSVARNELSVGQVVFYWTMIFEFAFRTRVIGIVGTRIHETITFITPFVKVMKFKPVIKEAKNPILFPKKLKHGIEFRNVTFYYPGQERPALKNFNLFIRPGESIALVGENGAGKTTIIKLLARLYDVSSGEILIDGRNIKEYSIKSLHEGIGIIFQDFMKYEALAAENIGFGRIEGIEKEEEIHHASVKSEAWEFIRNLSKQYKTHLGKRLKKGEELSIGQWQKIALARAFFKDAEILCLDEPTASMDAKAEYNIFKKFEKLTKGKTTILISHRFSTVRMANKIVVIEKGRVIEQGTHKELMKRNGVYAKLFKLQAKRYLDLESKSEN
jgi:ATP-binding cassette subfamily B protein